MSDAHNMVEIFGKDKINSLTKYPSILTYHQLGERGRLTESVTTAFADDDILTITEKIDGTNVRILLFADGSYLIGSREMILHASGDLYHGTDLGIVDAFYEHIYTPRLTAGPLQADTGIGPAGSSTPLTVIYGELYGGSITGAKHYGKSITDFRVFDIVQFRDLYVLGHKEHKYYSSLPLEEISRWREHKGPGGQMVYGQPFLPKHEAFNLAIKLGLLFVPPLSWNRPGPMLPVTVADTYAFLKNICPQSQARIDNDATGLPEGIVVTNQDRSKIVKIRFEDYERTLKSQKA